tara:strand:- start:68 stop:295 length:228 start_codon:yes stop_codon:yes gene_type:complete
MRCKICGIPCRKIGKMIEKYGNCCRECFGFTESFFTIQQFNAHLFYWSGCESTKMTGNLYKDTRNSIENLEFWKQ